MNSWTLAFLRSFIACIFFAPWINFKIPFNYMIKMIIIGSLQIGIMYLLYLNSFNYASVQKILLFTVTTPFYVSMISQMLNREFKLFTFFIVFVSVIGGLIIRMTSFNVADLTALLLVQLANICFASGQILYRELKKNDKHSINVFTDFAFFFIGASTITFLGLAISPYSYSSPESLEQWLLILWLGMGASGIGYYMWNYGSTKVKVETLATMNNLVIPLGLVVDIIFFGGRYDFQALLIGTLIIFSSIAASLKNGSN
jgi:drug/metabolite transporter (DMT)-like permease